MTKENITNYGKSIRSKLLNVAKKEDVFYSRRTPTILGKDAT